MTEPESTPAITPLEERQRLAVHEAAHATVAIILGVPVDVVSLRPGEGHRAVTLLAESSDISGPALSMRDAAPSQPPVARWAVERDIRITLAGAIGGLMVRVPTGYVAPEDDELAAEAVTASIERLPPAAAERLLKAEADLNDPDANDEAKVWWGVKRLDRDLHRAAVYLAYLRLVAESDVYDHRNAIRRMAMELLDKITISGTEAEAIVRTSRCWCHGTNGPPAEARGREGTASI